MPESSVKIKLGLELDKSELKQQIAELQQELDEYKLSIGVSGDIPWSEGSSITPEATGTPSAVVDSDRSSLVDPDDERINFGPLSDLLNQQLGDIYDLIDVVNENMEDLISEVKDIKSVLEEFSVNSPATQSESTSVDMSGVESAIKDCCDRTNLNLEDIKSQLENLVVQPTPNTISTDSNQTTPQANTNDTTTDIPYEEIIKLLTELVSINSQATNNLQEIITNTSDNNQSARPSTSGFAEVDLSPLQNILNQQLSSISGGIETIDKSIQELVSELKAINAVVQQFSNTSTASVDERRSALIESGDERIDFGPLSDLLNQLLGEMYDLIDVINENLLTLITEMRGLASATLEANPTSNGDADTKHVYIDFTSLKAAIQDCCQITNSNLESILSQVESLANQSTTGDTADLEVIQGQLESIINQLSTNENPPIIESSANNQDILGDSPIVETEGGASTDLSGIFDEIVSMVRDSLGEISSVLDTIGDPTQLLAPLQKLTEELLRNLLDIAKDGFNLIKDAVIDLLRDFLQDLLGNSSDILSDLIDNIRESLSDIPSRGDTGSSSNDSGGNNSDINNSGNNDLSGLRNTISSGNSTIINSLQGTRDVIQDNLNELTGDLVPELLKNTKFDFIRSLIIGAIEQIGGMVSAPTGGGLSKVANTVATKGLPEQNSDVATLSQLFLEGFTQSDPSAPGQISGQVQKLLEASNKPQPLKALGGAANAVKALPAGQVDLQVIIESIEGLEASLISNEKLTQGLLIKIGTLLLGLTSVVSERLNPVDDSFIDIPYRDVTDLTLPESSQSLLSEEYVPNFTIVGQTNTEPVTNGTQDLLQQLISGNDQLVTISRESVQKERTRVDRLSRGDVLSRRPTTGESNANSGFRFEALMERLGGVFNAVGGRLKDFALNASRGSTTVTNLINSIFNSISAFSALASVLLQFNPNLATSLQSLIYAMGADLSDLTRGAANLVVTGYENLKQQTDGVQIQGAIDQGVNSAQSTLDTILPENNIDIRALVEQLEQQLLQSLGRVRGGAETAREAGQQIFSQTRNNLQQTLPPQVLSTLSTSLTTLNTRTGQLIGVIGRLSQILDSQLRNLVANSRTAPALANTIAVGREEVNRVLNQNQTQEDEPETLFRAEPLSTILPPDVFNTETTNSQLPDFSFDIPGNFQQTENEAEIPVNSSNPNATNNSFDSLIGFLKQAFPGILAGILVAKLGTSIVGRLVKPGKYSEGGAALSTIQGTLTKALVVAIGTGFVQYVLPKLSSFFSPETDISLSDRLQALISNFTTPTAQPIQNQTTPVSTTRDDANFQPTVDNTVTPQPGFSTQGTAPIPDDFFRLGNAVQGAGNLGVANPNLIKSLGAVLGTYLTTDFVNTILKAVDTGEPRQPSRLEGLFKLLRGGVGVGLNVTGNQYDDALRNRRTGLNIIPGIEGLFNSLVRRLGGQPGNQAIQAKEQLKGVTRGVARGATDFLLPEANNSGLLGKAYRFIVNKALESITSDLLAFKKPGLFKIPGIGRLAQFGVNRAIDNRVGNVVGDRPAQFAQRASDFLMPPNESQGLVGGFLKGQVTGLIERLINDAIGVGTDKIKGVAGLGLDASKQALNEVPFRGDREPGLIQALLSKLPTLVTTLIIGGMIARFIPALINSFKLPPQSPLVQATRTPPPVDPTVLTGDQFDDILADIGSPLFKYEQRELNIKQIADEAFKTAGIDYNKVEQAGLLPTFMIDSENLYGGANAYQASSNTVYLNQETAAALEQEVIPKEAFLTIAHELRHAMQLAFGQRNLTQVSRDVQRERGVRVGRGTRINLNTVEDVINQDALPDILRQVQASVEARGDTRNVETVEALELDAEIFAQNLAEIFYDGSVLFREIIDNISTEISLSATETQGVTTATDLLQEQKTTDLSRLPDIALNTDLPDLELDKQTITMEDVSSVVDTAKEPLMDIPTEEPTLVGAGKQFLAIYGLGNKILLAINIAIETLERVVDAIASINIQPIPEELFRADPRNRRQDQEEPESEGNILEQFGERIDKAALRGIDLATSKTREKARDAGLRDDDLDAITDQAGGFVFANLAAFAPAGALGVLIAPLATALSGLGLPIAAAVSQLTPLAQMLVETMQILAPIRTRLSTVAGSDEGGEEMYQFAEGTAKSLNTPILSSVEGFSRLAAAARGTRLEGKDIEEIFIGLNQAMTALGLSSEDASLVFLAMQQIISKGRLTAEEVRLQLAERFPGVMQIIADSMQMTLAEVNSALENGELLANVVLPKLGKGLQEEFGDAAIRAKNSFIGSINEIQNNLFLLRKSFADNLGGAVGILSTGIAKVTGALTSFIDSAILGSGILFNVILGIQAMIIAGTAFLFSKLNIAKALTTAISGSYAQLSMILYPFIYAIVQETLSSIISAVFGIEIQDAMTLMINLFSNLIGTIIQRIIVLKGQTGALWEGLINALRNVSVGIVSVIQEIGRAGITVLGFFKQGEGAANAFVRQLEKVKGFIDGIADNRINSMFEQIRANQLNQAIPEGFQGEVTGIQPEGFFNGRAIAKATLEFTGFYLILVQTAVLLKILADYFVSVFNALGVGITKLGKALASQKVFNSVISASTAGLAGFALILGSIIVLLGLMAAKSKTVDPTLSQTSNTIKELEKVNKSLDALSNKNATITIRVEEDLGRLSRDTPFIRDMGLNLSFWRSPGQDLFTSDDIVIAWNKAIREASYSMDKPLIPIGFSVEDGDIEDLSNLTSLQNTLNSEVAVNTELKTFEDLVQLRKELTKQQAELEKDLILGIDIEERPLFKKLDELQQKLDGINKTIAKNESLTGRVERGVSVVEGRNREDSLQLLRSQREGLIGSRDVVQGQINETRSRLPVRDPDGGEVPLTALEYEVQKLESQLVKLNLAFEKELQARTNYTGRFFAEDSSRDILPQGLSVIARELPNVFDSNQVGTDTLQLMQNRRERVIGQIEEITLSNVDIPSRIEQLQAELNGIRALGRGGDELRSSSASLEADQRTRANREFEIRQEMRRLSMAQQVFGRGGVAETREQRDVVQDDLELINAYFRNPGVFNNAFRQDDSLLREILNRQLNQFPAVREQVNPDLINRNLVEGLPRIQAEAELEQERLNKAIADLNLEISNLEASSDGSTETIANLNKQLNELKNEANQFANVAVNLARAESFISLGAGKQQFDEQAVNRALETLISNLQRNRTDITPETFLDLQETPSLSNLVRLEEQIISLYGAELRARDALVKRLQEIPRQLPKNITGTNVTNLQQERARLEQQLITTEQNIRDFTNQYFTIQSAKTDIAGAGGLAGNLDRADKIANQADLNSLEIFLDSVRPFGRSRSVSTLDSLAAPLQASLVSIFDAVSKQTNLAPVKQQEILGTLASGRTSQINELLTRFTVKDGLVFFDEQKLDLSAQEIDNFTTAIQNATKSLNIVESVVNRLPKKLQGVLAPALGVDTRDDKREQLTEALIANVRALGADGLISREEVASLTREGITLREFEQEFNAIAQDGGKTNFQFRLEQLQAQNPDSPGVVNRANQNITNVQNNVADLRATDPKAASRFIIGTEGEDAYNAFQFQIDRIRQQSNMSAQTLDVLGFLRAGGDREKYEQTLEQSNPVLFNNLNQLNNLQNQLNNMERQRLQLNNEIQLDDTAKLEGRSYLTIEERRNIEKELEKLDTDYRNTYREKAITGESLSDTYEGLIATQEWLLEAREVIAAADLDRETKQDQLEQISQELDAIKPQIDILKMYQDIIDLSGEEAIQRGMKRMDNAMKNFEKTMIVVENTSKESLTAMNKAYTDISKNLKLVATSPDFVIPGSLGDPLMFDAMLEVDTSTINFKAAEEQLAIALQSFNDVKGDYDKVVRAAAASPDEFQKQLELATEKYGQALTTLLEAQQNFNDQYIKQQQALLAEVKTEAQQPVRAREIEEARSILGIKIQQISGNVSESAAENAIDEQKRLTLDEKYLSNLKEFYDIYALINEGKLTNPIEINRALEELTIQQLQIRTEIADSILKEQQEAREKAQKALEKETKLLDFQIDKYQSLIAILNVYTKRLELVAQIGQQIQSLNQAISTANQSNLQFGQGFGDAARDTREQLNNEDITNRERGFQQSRLGALQRIGNNVFGVDSQIFSQSEDAALAAQQRIATQMANDKLKALQEEQKLAAALLAIEVQRNAVAAQIALREAEINRLKATQAVLQANLGLQQAKETGSKDAIAIAEIELAIAQSQLQISQEEIQFAKENIAFQQVLGQLQKQQAQVEAGTARQDLISEIINDPNADLNKLYNPIRNLNRSRPEEADPREVFAPYLEGIDRNTVRPAYDPNEPMGLPLEAFNGDIQAWIESNVKLTKQLQAEREMETRRLNPGPSGLGDFFNQIFETGKVGEVAPPQTGDIQTIVTPTVDSEVPVIDSTLPVFNIDSQLGENLITEITASLPPGFEDKLVSLLTKIHVTLVDLNAAFDSRISQSVPMATDNNQSQPGGWQVIPWETVGAPEPQAPPQTTDKIGNLPLTYLNQDEALGLLNSLREALPANVFSAILEIGKLIYVALIDIAKAVGNASGIVLPDTAPTPQPVNQDNSNSVVNNPSSNTEIIQKPGIAQRLGDRFLSDLLAEKPTYQTNTNPQASVPVANKVTPIPPTFNRSINIAKYSTNPVLNPNIQNSFSPYVEAPRVNINNPQERMPGYFYRDFASEVRPQIDYRVPPGVQAVSSPTQYQSSQTTINITNKIDANSQKDLFSKIGEAQTKALINAIDSMRNT